MYLLFVPCISVTILWSPCSCPSLSLCLVPSRLTAIKFNWYFATLNISAVVMMRKWSQAVFICHSNGENLSAWSFPTDGKLKRLAVAVLRDGAVTWNCHKFDLRKVFHLACVWEQKQWTGFCVWIIITFFTPTCNSRCHDNLTAACCLVLPSWKTHGVALEKGPLLKDLQTAADVNSWKDRQRQSLAKEPKHISL